MKLEIYVCTHKKIINKLPDSYFPLQVGSALNDDLGYVRDDTGENISLKNKNYCELTGLYWIWKNVTADYVGLVHYRRFFYQSRLKAVLNYPISKKYIFRKLKKFDILLPKKFHHKLTTEEVYKRDHHISDLIELRNLITEECPEYIPAFDKMCKSQDAYLYNMFCCRKELVNQYCEWMFNLLFKLEERVDISGYDDYNKRIFGFLSERLFNVWLIKNKYRIKECYVYNLESDSMFGQAIRYPVHCWLKKHFSKIF